MKTIFAAMVLVLAGCTNDPRFHGDKDFTPEERAAIESAAQIISADTRTPPLEIIWDDDSDADRTIVRQQPPVQWAGGEYVIGEGRIYLKPDLGSYLRLVAEHEFGHALGLAHHEGPGVMNPKPQDTWTAQDIAECRRVGLCAQPDVDKVALSPREAAQ